MNVQIIQDEQGKSTGVYIPISEWEIIKADYPELNESQISIPQWEKEIVLNRIQEIKNNPSILLSIDSFFDDNK